MLKRSGRVGTISLDGPVGKRWLLIVQEETSVFDRRRSVDVDVVRDGKRFLMRDSDIRPPEPG